ncbi:MAG: hypothetical protein HZA24_01200 [Nitrospirae bacterium]|nr:hypothetical protein [Nitrospirota bacterium]
MGTLRKLWFSGRALAVIVVCAGLAGWGVWYAARADLALDGSGRDLAGARALVAELPPGTEVVLYGPSPLERLLTPLARGSDRLTVSRVDAPLVTPRPGLAAPRPGDVQVRSGASWLLLQRPDLGTVLWALALVASPYAPTPVAPPPLVGRAGGAPLSAPPPGPDRARAWALAGLLLPAAVATAGLWWGSRRRGQ